MKYRLKKLFVTALTIFLWINAYGQFVLNGESPGGLKWSRIKGERYKIIYPQGADSLAKRYLWLLEESRPAVMLGLGGIEPAKIPVVLHNRTMNSNGMVVWAPKRMELYTLPTTALYPQNWETQLALHEGRHVGQMTWFTKGIYKLGRLLIGQQAPSLGVAIYPSRWMLEGDAVVAETELTNSGRGRSAEFLEYYRASFLEDEPRNWERWKQGSYKHYTPSVYPAGYLINSTIRYKTGMYGYAGEIFEGYMKRFYNPNARNSLFRKYVGESPRKYFKIGRILMDSIWRSELPKRGVFTEGTELLSGREGGYVEYLSPVAVGQDSLIYIKYSYNNPTELVMVTDGKERVLRSFTTSAEGYDCDGDYIYFTENVASARWSNLVYGKLYKYNWRSGEMERLSDKTFYSSPCVDETGKQILVTEFFPEGGSAVTVLNSRTGEKLYSFMAPFNGQVSENVWLDGDIYALTITGKGAGLFRMPVKSAKGGEQQWEEVIGEQGASITNLKSYEDFLYFVSDIDGVRNVYKFNPESKELGRLTNSKYGASNPHISGGKLYYSNLELRGMYPVAVDLSGIEDCGSEYDPIFEGGTLKGNYKYVVAEELTRQAKEALGDNNLLAPDNILSERGNGAIVKYSTTEEEFAAKTRVENYSKLGNLFRFHSWAPFYYYVDKIMEFDYDDLHEVVSWGATAYSQNTLGTAVTMLGYSYHDNLHGGHLKFKYSGWYPSFQISADYNSNERYRYILKGDSQEKKSKVVELSSPLVELSAVVYLPLKFSSHGWQRGLTPQLLWEYKNHEYYTARKDGYVNANTLAGALQYYQMRGIAKSEIYPQWGFGILGKYRGAIAAQENFGTQSSLYIYGYLPGIWENHGIKLSVSGQIQSVGGKNYYLGNLVNMPRGYSDDVFGKEYLMGTADYALPVHLGDTRVANFLYLKRLQVIPFADYAINRRSSVANGISTTQTMGLYSYGVSLLVDFHLFSIGTGLSAGIRFARNGNDGGIPVDKSSVAVLFSTALF